MNVSISITGVWGSLCICNWSWNKKCLFWCLYRYMVKPYVLLKWPFQLTYVTFFAHGVNLRGWLWFKKIWLLPWLLSRCWKKKHNTNCLISRINLLEQNDLPSMCNIFCKQSKILQEGMSTSCKLVCDILCILCMSMIIFFSLFCFCGFLLGVSI